MPIFHSQITNANEFMPVASLGRAGAVRPGVTLQEEKIVGKFTKNSGETRSDR